MYQPLADRIRPQSLDEVVGQRHILGEDGLLRRVIESGKIPNMVFYGPSGTGKTTVANLIANRAGRTLRRLNATTASLSDVREVMDEVGTLLAPNGVLLYLDEIQYFNKKQQQSLLEFLENGKITLIAATTENPYFTIFNAILSRCSSSRPSPPRTCCRRWTGGSRPCPKSWGWKPGASQGCGRSWPPPAAATCARRSTRWSF